MRSSPNETTLMSTLLFERSLPRFAAARVVSSFGSGRGAGVGPLRLVEREAPRLPSGGWTRVDPLLSGICGSDLATLDGRSSRYFEDIVSFPFVPGHEVVGRLAADTTGADGAALAAGTRVVLQPVLGCAARGIVPPCPACQTGHVGNCGYLAFGHIRPGLQTGFCADTGGGWSTTGLVAHESQLFAVPEGLSDEDAVTIEPVACAVHAVLNAGIREADLVAVVGAGMLGLTVTAALAHLVATGRSPAPRSLLVGAKYGHQQRLAREFGATEALPPEQLTRAVRRHSHSLSYGGAAGDTATLSGGADIVIDCVGSAESIAQSLAMVRPRGTVALVGMPGKVTIDLAPLWHREVRLAGAYAYGTEAVLPAAQRAVPAATNKAVAATTNKAVAATASRRRRSAAQPEAVTTFSLAFKVVAAMSTGRLVSATYPLARFEEAVAHAGSAGRRGSVKIAFDITKGHTR
jgi:threonine dehydrogenase-like Zn-dependent dehydrogenase